MPLAVWQQSETTRKLKAIEEKFSLRKTYNFKKIFCLRSKRIYHPPQLF